MDAMRKIASIIVAAVFAATGAGAPSFAALSASDGTALRQQGDIVQVAARGGDRGGRNEGGRKDAGRNNRDKKGGKVIWRIRDGKAQPFFLFRGRGDCRTEIVRTRDGSTRQAWVCN
jgi:hypothetical protein